MSYDDVVKYFGRIQICNLVDSYHYSFLKAYHDRGSYSLMRLMISSSGEHTVSVSQTDSRCFSRHSEYDYSNCRMILMEITEDADSLDKLKVKYLKGASGWDRETHLIFESLPKGSYFVYVEFDWAEATEDTDFCVTCYGASKSFYLRDEKSLF